MDAKDREQQLYTLEYEKGAERYENIYRSMWTIFSYLTAVAAGLLAFGSETIEHHALVCLAAGPLIFWFWTTYLPLDRYGNDAVARLGTIEGILNRQFHTDLKHFSVFVHPLRVSAGIARAFACPYASVDKPTNLHAARYPRLAKLGHRIWATPKALWYQLRRARAAIFFFFVLLHVVVYFEATEAWRARKAGLPIFHERTIAKPTPGGTRE
jgi:hypothetical protein